MIKVMLRCLCECPRGGIPGTAVFVFGLHHALLVSMLNDLIFSLVQDTVY